jgi:filamentous hemagglutinin
MAERGIQLPAWDAANPDVIMAWRAASRQFAEGAQGAVRVLQGESVRATSVWAEVEFPALQANPAVTSITAVDSVSGVEALLWAR